MEDKTPSHNQLDQHPQLQAEDQHPLEDDDPSVYERAESLSPQVSPNTSWADQEFPVKSRCVGGRAMKQSRSSPEPPEMTSFLESRILENSVQQTALIGELTSEVKGLKEALTHSLSAINLSLQELKNVMVALLPRASGRQSAPPSTDSACHAAVSPPPPSQRPSPCTLPSAPVAPGAAMESSPSTSGSTTSPSCAAEVRRSTRKRKLKPI
nr:PREDICTED: uncharacterized protein LOC106702215 [Latimeria chalumnae]|eukprot:XP_014339852.1 PREDICTED: uncharacterized protein LOC106702215 [Latimeria chalumnae]